MIPIVTAVLNVVGITMLLQFVVSFDFIRVVNAPQNMVAYGTETFSARGFVRTGLVLTVIALALVMLLSITYWRWLGYVQRRYGIVHLVYPRRRSFDLCGVERLLPSSAAARVLGTAVLREEISHDG